VIQHGLQNDLERLIATVAVDDVQPHSQKTVCDHRSLEISQRENALVEAIDACNLDAAYTMARELCLHYKEDFRLSLRSGGTVRPCSGVIDSSRAYEVFKCESSTKFSWNDARLCIVSTQNFWERT
jgi:hypothetical protein